MDALTRALGRSLKPLTRPLRLESHRVFDGFEDSDPAWTQISGTVTKDATNIKTGSKALKLSATASGNARARRDFTPPGGHGFTLDIYVEDPTNLTEILFYFTPDAFASWFQFRIPTANLKTGWQRIGFSIRDASWGGDYDDFSNVDQVQIGVFASASGTANVWIDDFASYTMRPAVTLTFDDGFSEWAENAMPALREYGWAGTGYVVTDAVDAASPYAFTDGGSIGNTISTWQLRQLQAAGWDICSHTNTHPDLTLLGAAAQETELQTARNWLRDNGFTKGMRFFATPYGKRDANTLTAMKLYHENLRDASSAGHTGFENSWLNQSNYNTPTGYFDTKEGLRYQEISSLDGTAVATFQGWVDDAIKWGSWLVLVFHNVESAAGGYLTEGLFREYLDVLDGERGSLDVLTMSEYWDSLQAQRRLVV